MVLVFLLSLQGAALAQNDIPWGSNLDLGNGLDVLSGTLKGDCVVRTPPERIGGDSQRVFLDLQQVTSREEFARLLDVSASASLKAGVFSASAKARYLTSENLSSYSVYLLVRAIVENVGSQMRDVKPTEAALALAGLADDGETFRRTCGDVFVRGMTTGGEFFAFYEFRAQSEAAFQELKAKAQAAYGPIGGGSGAVKQTIEEMRSIAELRVSVFREGTLGEVIPTAIPTIIDQAVNFPVLITDPERAYPYQVTVVSYDTIPEIAAVKSSLDVELQRHILDRLGEQHLQFLDVVSDIEYVLAHPRQFEAFDPGPLAAKANDLRGAINAILDAARVCFRAPDDCRELTDLPDLAVRLPDRKLGDVVTTGNLLVNADFEHPEPTVGGFIRVARWCCDYSEIVMGRRGDGVAPQEGDGMLQLLRSSSIDRPSAARAADVHQVVDLRRFRDEIRSGEARIIASVWVNRVGQAPGVDSEDIDSEMGAYLWAFSGEMPTGTRPDFNGPTNIWKSVVPITILTDDDPETWELARQEFPLPPDTTYVTFQVYAPENKVNDTCDAGDEACARNVEFHGHYADNATLRLRIPVFP